MERRRRQPILEHRHRGNRAGPQHLDRRATHPHFQVNQRTGAKVDLTVGNRSLEIKARSLAPWLAQPRLRPDHAVQGIGPHWGSLVDLQGKEVGRLLALTRAWGWIRARPRSPLAFSYRISSTRSN
jgi:hypothetical protein